jgi:hypothetical protein
MSIISARCGHSTTIVKQYAIVIGGKGALALLKKLGAVH